MMRAHTFTHAARLQTSNARTSQKKKTHTHFLKRPSKVTTRLPRRGQKEFWGHIIFWEHDIAQSNLHLHYERCGGRKRILGKAEKLWFASGERRFACRQLPTGQITIRDVVVIGESSAPALRRLRDRRGTQPNLLTPLSPLSPANSP